MPQDLREWALQFWAQIARLDDAWRHAEFAGDSSKHHLEIEPEDRISGRIVVSHLWAHEVTEIGRHTFTLAESPAAAAQQVIQLIRSCRQKPGIDLMHKDDFLRTLERATLDADDALRLRDTLARWAERLLPYLEREPGLTVGEALERFESDSEPRHA